MSIFSFIKKWWAGQCDTRPNYRVRPCVGYTGDPAWRIERLTAFPSGFGVRFVYMSHDSICYKSKEQAEDMIKHLTSGSIND